MVTFKCLIIGTCFPQNYIHSIHILCVQPKFPSILSIRVTAQIRAYFSSYAGASLLFGPTNLDLIEPPRDTFQIFWPLSGNIITTVWASTGILYFLPRQLPRNKGTEADRDHRHQINVPFPSHFINHDAKIIHGKAGGRARDTCFFRWFRKKIIFFSS